MNILKGIVIFPLVVLLITAGWPQEKMQRKANRQT